MINQKLASLEARITRLESSLNQKQASWMSTLDSKHDLNLDLKNQFLSNINVKKIKDLLNMKTKRYGLEFVLGSTNIDGRFSAEQFMLVCKNLDGNPAYPPIYFEFSFNVEEEKLYFNANAWLPKNISKLSPDAEESLAFSYTEKVNVNVEVVEYLVAWIDQIKMEYPY